MSSVELQGAAQGSFVACWELTALSAHRSMQVVSAGNGVFTHSTQPAFLNSFCQLLLLLSPSRQETDLNTLSLLTGAALGTHVEMFPLTST